MVAIQRVAGSRKVVIITFGREHIIRFVVDSFERNGWSAVIAFGSVVENDVQQNFDALPVKFLDQCFKFVNLHTVFTGCGVTRFRREEIKGAVTPVIYKQFAGYRVFFTVFVLVEFVNGHQFYASNTQFKQIWDFLPDTGKSPFKLNS